MSCAGANLVPCRWSVQASDQYILLAILIQNLDQLWALWGVIMASGIASGVLIYFQIWRPYKAEVDDQVD